MKVKSVVVALGLLASAGLAAGAQSRTTKKPAAKTTTKAKSKTTAKPAPIPANLHFTVAPTGNEARYLVRETLVGHDLPSDAVGKAHDITGMIVVKPNGTIVSDSSRITINVQTMKSDKSARDKTLKTQSIETDKYPTIDFVPTSITGLTAKPGTTDTTFMVTGNLTVHGGTHPLTWTVVAHSAGNDVLGTAKTKFTFDQMGLTPPHKPILSIALGVADTIRLEYDFHFIQVPPK